MLKIRLITLTIALQALTFSPVHAGVSFIVGDGDTANSSQQTNTSGAFQKECRQKGFGLPSSSCSGNTLPGLLCPLNPDYTDTCCSAEYAYVITSSCLNGTIPSSDTCGGRYRCICDPINYPKGPGRENCTGKFAYNEVNYCTESYFDGNGMHHETRYYTSCTCSPSYAKCNPSYRLHGVGDGCSYGGDIYYASCACDSGYNKLCLSSGPKDSSDYCQFNRTKYYRECNNNESDDKNDNDTMDSLDQ